MKTLAAAPIHLLQPDMGEVGLIKMSSFEVGAVNQRDIPMWAWLGGLGYGY